MNRPKTFPSLLLAAVSLAFLLRGVTFPAAQDARGPRTPQAWTLDAALTQMRLHPQDAYLQYVALQLARREGRFQAVEQEVSRLVPTDRTARAERRDSVDLFSIFNGALAVQESLQLDAMRFAVTGDPRPTPEPTPDFTNYNLAVPPPAPP